ncbi:Cytochrome bd-II ubiquinol oxidase subunit 1 [Pseudobythopirellula maris]|uniref:Cytochrome bd-II ubiquinol oxidase subunit 1 n=1 Tax=Pseudobythopirellula maris TaxID=2527991 RepID=A0A5C5ZR88_9BACT|nr:cytochrome ubiquinol oxidase subunit I [Pseudobythopirellula maris]TWT89800.1 Cytochrome bd-II ubiquinol oxidase subunit 1 [Pseudobythopirellula maris]
MPDSLLLFAQSAAGADTAWGLDVVVLSRLQFALTIMFHYLFPPLTIGMSVVLVYLKGRHLATGAAIYDDAARFWTKIFGLNFAMGVVTGIVMEFQFGTNWAAYSRFVGDVFGSALAAEGIFAFFLESGFLSLLLFGWDRVGPKTHFFATLMVAVGGIFSSVWIVIANSWQQTPAGSEIRDYVVNGQVYQRAEIVDFWALVFNPSSMNRLVHVWLGAFLLGAFFVMSISAWYLIKRRHEEFARRSFVGGLLLATVAAFAQLLSGHEQANAVAEYQPAKLAAMEGVYETTDNAPIYLFGSPNDETETVDYGLAVPGMLSWLLAFDTSAEVQGLDELDPIYGRPPVWITFQAYHLMVAIGSAMIAMTLLAWLYYWRGRLFTTHWLLWLFVLMVVPAFVANEAGWVAAEVGRQPWIVYPRVVDGVAVDGLRTSDGVSEAVSADQVLGSILFFGLIYTVLFGLWISLLHTKISHGPAGVAAGDGRAGHDEHGGFVEAVTEMVSHREGMTGDKSKE